MDRVTVRCTSTNELQAPPSLSPISTRASKRRIREGWLSEKQYMGLAMRCHTSLFSRVGSVNADFVWWIRRGIPILAACLTPDARLALGVGLIPAAIGPFVCVHTRLDDLLDN